MTFACNLACCGEVYQTVKILIVSSVVPARGRGGGCLALYRHFVERQDFAVAACGHMLELADEVEAWIVSHGRVLHRLARTRLNRPMTNVRSLVQWQKLPSGLLQRARAWRPDVIFNVADHETSGWAWQLSRHLGVPLAVNFQDLFPLTTGTYLGQGLYPFLRDYHLDKFRFLNSNADAVFYTCEGMRDWFGGSPNGHVLYPLGAAPQAPAPAISVPTGGRPVRLTYAGNCYGAYGRMMLRLARHLEQHPGIQLSIFTMGNDWPEADVRSFQASGVFRGQLDFADLQHELQAADAFLTVMSFEPEWQLFNQTSFTTKWLDYAPFGKPVFVWGPADSSAARFARKHNCGAATISDSPEDLRQSVLSATADPSEWKKLSEASRSISQTILNPERIHGVLKRALERLCP